MESRKIFLIFITLFSLIILFEFKFNFLSLVNFFKINSFQLLSQIFPPLCDNPRCQECKKYRKK